MTSITWVSPRYVQELTTILGPQNRTQGSCDILFPKSVLKETEYRQVADDMYVDCA